MMREFVHLHSHSHYSLLEALPQVDSLADAAIKDGQKALAITDNGNMYAAIEFYKYGKKKGIKPIIGVDFFVAPRTRHDKEHRIDDRTSRLVLIAKDIDGYKNLMLLVSKSHLEGFYYRPRIDRELLEAHHDGLVAILPSFGGEHAHAIKDGQIDKARESLAWYHALFGGLCYAEITRHNEIEGHEARMQEIISLARAEGIPLVAAHDTYYLRPDDAVARELVNKIRTGGRLDREAAGELHDFSFVTQAEANRLFADLPEALDNTVNIADMCDIDLNLGSWLFPDYKIPEDTTYDAELRALTFAGFQKRGVVETPEVLERVEYELSVISKKGYSPYFLVVSDLLRYAKSAGILTNIRGSVAGSLVTYLAGITNVNPLEYNLPFERFLNPERPSAPDIDMDYADNRRDDMIAYAREKYGNDHVAQIGTFGTMLARAAVRDVARALGHSYGTGDRIAKMIPFPKQGFPVFIKSSIDTVPELKELYENDADARDILDLAQRIEGNARHVGVHAAGVVIAPRPVTDFTPVQFDPKGGKIITQYEMHAVEDAGLLKFDFLGLTNLSTLADALARVKERLGVTIDIDGFPLDDKKTFEMLARGETMGVFQLAGSGMTAYLVDLKPTVIHDINAMVALYRPGPMNFIPDYIERKKNPKLIKYLDPRMEHILENSYGVITYQDDVLYIAIELAGYTWLEADKFRKAMGKKIPEEMAAQKEKFQKGCLEHGMKPDIVKQLWEQIETFAAYGFNKAHAASYGNLAYKTAYMKANYPLDYMAALLTADAGEVEKIADIVAECKRMKIDVLPPSVNESRGTFTVVAAATSGNVFGGLSQADACLPVGQGPRVNAAPAGADSDHQKHSSNVAAAEHTKPTHKESIRFGLYSIKNFGEGVADSIIAARDADGPFKDIGDFLERVGDKNLNKKSLESLIKCGAFDDLPAQAGHERACERGELLSNLELLLSAHREYRSAPSNQDSLFGALALTTQHATLKLVAAPAASLEQKLAWEKELLGLYVSGHPLDRHKEKLAKQKMPLKVAKEKFPRGVETVIGGFLEEGRAVVTKNGEKMMFGKLTDYTDGIEVVAFPRTYKEYESLLAPGTCILLKGKFAERNGEVSFVIDKIKGM